MFYLMAGLLIFQYRKLDISIYRYTATKRYIPNTAQLHDRKTETFDLIRLVMNRWNEFSMGQVVVL